MRTDDLITLLAQGAGAAPRGHVPRRIGAAMAFGLAAAVAAAYAGLGFIAPELWRLPAPWFKLAYAAAMTAAAAWLASRLARPGSRSLLAARVAGLVVLAAGCSGALAWQATRPELRWTALLGHSWWECPLFVLAFSLPALAALLWALRGLAPTQARAAGFAAGLLAGALGAGGYALACNELALSFVAAWYTLGMLLSALLGALLGPRLLRW